MKPKTESQNSSHLSSAVSSPVSERVVVEVVAYRPDWQADFDQEQALITEQLSSHNVAGIHHIGSTSVPGLWAKPLIDILLEVHSLALLDQETERLVRLGYEAMGEFGIPERRFFRKGSATQRTHHLHAFLAGSPQVKRHLAFRDYLRAFPEIRDEYAAVKREGARLCQNEMARYISHKNDFILHHEAQALCWQAAEPEKGDMP